jgi:carbamoyl-phosphate synthase small subunit
MLALAANAKIKKLKFGHRGINHPVMNLETFKTEITSQNHGFCVDFASLGALIPKESGGITKHFNDLRKWSSMRIQPVVQNKVFGRIKLTHISLNDGTLEGIKCLDKHAFAVQYHPEATPGPTDSAYLFDEFLLDIKRFKENKKHAKKK